MDNSILTKKEELKKELVEKYFNEYVNTELSKLEIRMIYSDKKIYKYLVFPKRIYRNYYLYIKSPFIEKKIAVGYKEKDRIKKTLKMIYSR